MRWALLSGVALLLQANSACGNDAGGSLESWEAHRDTLAKDPTVLRFFSFEEKSGATLHNLAGAERAGAPPVKGDARIATNQTYIESHPLRSEQAFPLWSGGRWAGKGALSFGEAPQSVSGSHFYSASGNHFTVSMWVRVNRDLREKTSTDLCYVEDATNSGWKLTAGAGYSAFSLARPPGRDPGQGSIAAYGPALTGHVWHQVVAELDGNAIVLFVDGKQAARKEFDGIYTQPRMADLAAKRPELDNGGLIIGNRTIPANPDKPAPRTLFDMDEFVLYDRALSGDDIAADYKAGNPVAAPEVQIAEHRAQMARRAMLDSIAVTIPTDSYGYFPVQKPVVVTMAAPALDGVAGPLTATVALRNFASRDLLSTEKRSLAPAASAAAPASMQVALTLPRCGLYGIEVQVNDSGGKLLKTASFPIAGIELVPAPRDIPATSPLAGHDILLSHPADVVLGTRFERMIAPFLRIFPDGSYDWKIPDARIAADLKFGLEPLYTIYPPFNMPKNSPQELARDPARWSAWVKDLVTHFKGKVHYWEVWNEPNAVPGFSAADYVILLKTAYAAIKEVDPTATVLGGSGVYTIPQWTEGVLAAGGGPSMDILSVHNYIGSSPITYRNRYGKLRQVRDLLVKYLGHPFPVWNSEGGIHQPARVDGRPMTDAEMLQLYGSRANKDDGWAVAGVDAIMMTTEHRSACWNVQSILLDLADGDQKYFTLMGAGTFYPFKSSSEGLPTEKGIAYAALARVLSNSATIDWLPLSNSKAAGILVTDKQGRRTAILFSDRPLEFNFAAAGRAGYDGMDYLGNPLHWKAEDGSLALKTSDEPISVFDVPADFQEHHLISAPNFPGQLAPGQGFDGVLKVTNPGQKPLSVTLEADCPAGKVNFGAGLDASTATALVPPQGNSTVPFRFTADNVTRGIRLVRFVLKAGGKSISQLETPFYAAGPAARVAQVAVPATGAALETDAIWQGTAMETANTAGQVAIGKPDVGFTNPNTWQGPDDCSYTVRTAWHPGDALYVKVEVRDDTFHPTPAGNNQPWLFDGLELFVDTRAAGQRAASLTAGAQQIMVIPAGGTAPSACRVMNLAGNNATVDAVFSGHVTVGGYVLYGKISPLPGSGWNPAAGGRLGLDFAIDDNDDGVKRKSQLVLHGTASNVLDTSRWGEYELGG